MTYANIELTEISPLSPVLLDFIGSVLSFIFILCVMLNFIMLYVFMRYKEIRSSVNKLVMTVAVINLFSSFQFPYLIKSYFAHRLHILFEIVQEFIFNFFNLYIFKFYRWMGSKLDCVFLGFLNNFVGCMQIYLMVGISYVRYDILSRELDLKTVNTRIILNSVAISSLLSLFWSLAPLLGWSSYTLEEGLVSCSAKYNEQSWNVVSYNMAMLLFVYFMPFLLTVILNVKSIFNVSYYFIFFFLVFELGFFSFL